MSKAIIVKCIKELSAEDGFTAETYHATKAERLALTDSYKKSKNIIINSGKYDALLTPVVMSQLDEWMMDLYSDI